MFKLFLQLTLGTSLVRKHQYFHQDPGSSDINSKNLANREGSGPPAWFRLIAPDKVSSLTTPTIYPHNLPNKVVHIKRVVSMGKDRIEFSQCGGWSAVYLFAHWSPLTAWNLLPVKVCQGRTPLLRSPDRMAGLADITREASLRIKSFELRYAIRYSYFKDMRFILLVCSLLGVTLWWSLAPERLLLHPAVLSSPDLNLFYRVARDTFIDNVCSSQPHIILCNHVIVASH